MQQIFNFLNLFGTFHPNKNHTNKASADMLIRFAKRENSLDDDALSYAVDVTKEEMDELDLYMNGEVTPGKLYDHYSKALYRLDEKLNELKEIV